VDVRYATDDAFLGDDVLFRYGGELAMGLALLRARYLDGEARQLALWDGERAHGHAGTAIDVATWRATGRPATIVSPGGELIEGLPVPAEPALAAEPPLVTRSSAPGTSYRRVIRAMLFGDVRGFSKLTDDQLPTFATRVLGAFSDVIDRYGEHVEHRNTWGDAVYIVLRTPAAAAACALELQAAMTSIDLEAEGLPSHLALRLGGHVGPVFPVLDPVIRQKAFMGSHVSRTARIEPVAPAGTVYVTAPFAAALILRGERKMTCDYVGHMPAAKGYGKLRMYRLQATPSGDRRTK
jgi:class 3 adenylate cyclase